MSDNRHSGREEDAVRAVEAKMGTLVMRANRGTWRLRLAKLGEHAVPAGALVLAARRLGGVDRTSRLRRAPRLPTLR